MKRFLLYIAILAICAGLAGCASLVKNPRVTIQKTSITGVDSSGVNIEFHIRIDNPNSFDLALLGYSYDLQLMAVPFLSGNNQEEVSFPAGQLTDLRLPVKIKFGDLMEIIKRRPEADRIPYRMTASLNIRTPVGEVVVPVDKNDVFQVPEAYRPGNFIRRFMQPLKEIR